MCVICGEDETGDEINMRCCKSSRMCDLCILRHWVTDIESRCNAYNQRHYRSRCPFCRQNFCIEVPKADADDYLDLHGLSLAIVENGEVKEVIICSALPK